MGMVTILPETTQTPITLMGQRAGVCWGADTADDAKNYRRGWDCVESGHGRVMEFVEVCMVLDGYSARVMREWYTHIGGAPTRLQASTRYISYGKFDYVTPPSLDEIGFGLGGALYRATMDVIADTIRWLEANGVPREDAAMLLPLGMTTRVVDRRNLRNLVDMSRQRECKRAFWEYRELMRDIKLALTNYSEEWGRLVAKLMHSKCVELGYCTEKNGCGMYPKREPEKGVG